MPKWIESSDSNSYLYTHVHGSIIHDSQEVEMIQVSIKKCVKQQNMVYTHNEILFSHKRNKFWCMWQ